MQITLNKYFFIRLDIDYLSLKPLSLPIRWSRISTMFVVVQHHMRVCSSNQILIQCAMCCGQY